MTTGWVCCVTWRRGSLAGKFCTGYGDAGGRNAPITVGPMVLIGDIWVVPIADNDIIESSAEDSASCVPNVIC